MYDVIPQKGWGWSVAELVEFILTKDDHEDSTKSKHPAAAAAHEPRGSRRAVDRGDNKNRR